MSPQRRTRVFAGLLGIALACGACSRNREPQPLPPDELKKLQAQARWCVDQETLCVDLYNGSGWEVQEITVSIKDKSFLQIGRAHV